MRSKPTLLVALMIKYTNILFNNYHNLQIITATPPPRHNAPSLVSKRKINVDNKFQANYSCRRWCYYCCCSSSSVCHESVINLCPIKNHKISFAFLSYTGYPLPSLTPPCSLHNFLCCRFAYLRINFFYVQ